MNPDRHHNRGLTVGESDQKSQGFSASREQPEGMGEDEEEDIELFEIKLLHESDGELEEGD